MAKPWLEGNDETKGKLFPVSIPLFPYFPFQRALPSSHRHVFRIALVYIHPPPLFDTLLNIYWGSYKNKTYAFSRFAGAHIRAVIHESEIGERESGFIAF